MGFFLPRKLLSDSNSTTLSDPCFFDCNGPPETCFLSCLKVCREILCKQAYDDDYEYLSPNPHHHDGIKRITIISISVLASLFLFACLLTVYIKSKSRARAARSRSRSDMVEFLDEDHGPVVDHPIWYIRTIGLQPSVIGSIPVCRYKNGDGLVEETECSVCLSQFEEDETLRLLPKCNHAFHVNCIDTWLRSHTNCPICRAPIVTNAAAPASSGVGIQIPEETQVETQQEHQEPENVIGEREDQSGDTDVPGMQRVRRSVSMDSLSASKINQAVLDRNHSRFGSTRTKEPNQRRLRLARSSSIVGRSFLKRSVSCSAKFLLPR